jgi:fermentation-respiration switch protein FrsA (DUF1100 family)
MVIVNIGYRSPAEHDMPYEDVWLTTSDGIKLHAWWIKGATVEETRKRPTLLFFHANAGNMGFRLQNLKVLHAKVHLNIFIISYRGYGASEGEPGEAGFLIDAETCWQHLLQRPDVDTKRILVFGRSMGGAVAIAHTARHNDEVKGMILENTFSCISDMADQCAHEHMTISIIVVLITNNGATYHRILRLDWNSIGRIKSITAPIIFFSGLLDEVVPPQQMNKLYGAASGSRDRKLVTIVRGQHNDTWLEGGADYVRALARFVEACTGFTPPCIDPDHPISITLAASLPPPPSASGAPGSQMLPSLSTTSGNGSTEAGSNGVPVSADERAKLIANLRAAVAKADTAAAAALKDSDTHDNDTSSTSTAASSKATKRKTRKDE